MSNSYNSSKKLITPEKAAIILPTIIGSFIAIIIVSIFSMPKFINSNKVNTEYKEYLRKKNELPNLRSQYEIINKKLKKLNNQKEKIITLISGETDLNTFLSRLGFLGKKNNINFENIVPNSYVKFVESDNNDIQNELDINNDPLLVEGVKKYVLNINFKAKFENILSFLRDLESQENIILLEDISIASQKGNESSNKNENIGSLDVNLLMVIYGKI